MIASTAQPDQWCRSFNEWAVYINNEYAAMRAVCQVRRHLRLVELAATARAIQRKNRS